MMSKREAEAKYGLLLPAIEAAKFIEVGYMSFKALLEAGYLEGTYLVAGKDVQKQGGSNRSFIANRLAPLKGRFAMLSRISEISGIPSDLLRKYSRQGIIQPIPGTNYLWDSVEVIRLANQHILDRRSRMKEEKSNYKEFLGPNLTKQIDEYIGHRSQKNPIKYKGIKCHTGFSNDDRANEVRRTLHKVFYRIICYRAEIVGFERYTEKGFSVHYRPLNSEELDKVMIVSSSFSPKDLYHEDLKPLRLGISQSSYQRFCSELKSFIIWYLKKMQLDPSNSQFLHPENYPMFLDTESRLLLMIDEMPDERNSTEPRRSSDVFLTREQIVMGYQAIITSKLKDAFSVSVRWMVSCLLGLRPPMELRHLRIEHFKLTKQGFLQIDAYGYGILDFPAKYSKGAYGASDGTLKTLVVPPMAELLNRYLRYLYEKSPRSKRGEGWLFRPHVWLPEENYAGRAVSKPFNTLREFEWCPEDIIVYDTRRSMHNLIYQGRIADLDLQKKQKRAGQIQMRHAKNGSIAEIEYTEDPTSDEYRAILDRTLNFPWDLDELERWEIERGYRKTNPGVLQQLPSPSVQPSLPTVELTEEQKGAVELLKQYQSEYAKLGKGKPKNMKADVWMQRLDWIQQQISQLEASSYCKF